MSGVTQFSERIIAVVPASLKDQVNSWLATNISAGAGSTFTVGLSPTGANPATHYWCSWTMTLTRRQQIEPFLKGNALARAGVKIFDATTNTPDDVLTQVGLKPLTDPTGP